MRSTFAGSVAVLGLAGLLASHAGADTVALPADRDNTLYKNISTETSNGAGDHMFTGISAIDEIRRAVLRFDVQSAVPPGSTVTAVSLRLYLSRTVVGPSNVAAHRLTSDWGEGTSDAVSGEGAGAAPEPGDATWFNRFFPGSPWGTPGGDFVAAASAIIQCNADETYYTWSGPGMVANVQAWVDGTAPNYGWVMIGKELPTTVTTAKRFDTRTNPTEAFRPLLTIEFTPPPSCEADLTGDGRTDFADLNVVLAAWQTGAGGDVDDDGDTDFDDLNVLLQNFGCGIA